MSASSQILIAGIGNIFLGDDAFGSEVAQRLLQISHPPGVQVVDFGIRGLDLMYALAGGYDAAILIDAVQRGQAPGTLFLIEPHLDAPVDGEESATLDAHSMDPLKVLRAAASMGPLPGQLFIVGCEPSPLPGDEEMQMEMSAPVSAAIEEAGVMVREIASRLLAGRSVTLSQEIALTNEASVPPAQAVAAHR